MRVVRLQTRNLRAIDAADFSFQPGLNLLVGVNGVGKTSVLDAMTVCLSHVVSRANRLGLRPKAFGTQDIRSSAQALTVEATVEIDAALHTSVISRRGDGRWLARIVGDDLQADGSSSPPANGRPLAVLFSTRRAVPSGRVPRAVSYASSVIESGAPVPSGEEVLLTARSSLALAHADAFAPRELRIVDLAYWLRAQAAQASERGSSAQALATAQAAVERFLPGYRNVRLGSSDPPSLLVDRDDATLDVRQLSDGERGLLALVLDLSRRLALANPEMHDPALEAEAVVLIDEIDLHLHPQWQRDVVNKLTRAFPECQFIATTHSPQVIGEVEPDRVHVMTPEGVHTPEHAYGVDASRVLEEIMDTPPRTPEIETKLRRVSRMVDNDNYAEARELLASLAERLGENDPDVIRVETLLNFMEAGLEDDHEGN